ncbi:OmpA family protein [Desulforhopalus vacuolatus]|uniref:OmpA family protein n=1 Tax=Desulforhopalus vacuolatus TaxID=40414 RepID=UPI0019645444|nr:OmpA family protein [Desulforhopalus vacuolatus]MBM9518345.1 OmpA family protein [Desulforhopalus vacuolatus]
MFKGYDFQKDSENEWVSISDLMSVLMIIFLFIAISYMHNVQQNQLNVKKVAVAYQELQIDLYLELWEEFKEDLPSWKAVIEKETLSIRFEEPEVLFAIGSSQLSIKFETILNDFFPRYIRIISSEKYNANIEEIRIEGHTSSEWNDSSLEMEAYFNNMKLSQNRTRSVLQYCMGLIQEPEVLMWSKKYLTANGLSSSRPIFTSEGLEDRLKSRRVEFRTKTNAEKKVVEIIEHMEKM